jgi:hypothetical protein
MFGSASVFWVVYAITLAIEWSDFPKEAANAMLGVLIFGGFIWLLAGLFYVNSGIKPSCITSDWAEIVGVDKGFALEWKDMEDEAEDRPKKKWSKRRKSDDEYDD